MRTPPLTRITLLLGPLALLVLCQTSPAQKHDQKPLVLYIGTHSLGGSPSAVKASIPGELPIAEGHELLSFRFSDEVDGIGEPGGGSRSFEPFTVVKRTTHGGAQLLAALRDETAVGDVKIVYQRVNPATSQYEPFLEFVINKAYVRSVETERLRETEGGDEGRPWDLVMRVAFSSIPIEWASYDLPDPLPVALASMTALADPPDVLVQWTTLSESHLASFEVEHLRGASYESLASVLPAGGPFQPSSYEVRLEGLDAGDHTFRIRSVGMDGSSEVSRPVEVKLELVGERFRLVEPHPNPATDRVHFDLTVEVDQHLEADVFDLLGRRVLKGLSSELSANRRERFEIDVSGIPAGLYMLRIRGNNFIESRPLRIVH